MCVCVCQLCVCVCEREREGVAHKEGAAPRAADVHALGAVALDPVALHLQRMAYGLGLSDEGFWVRAWGLRLENHGSELRG